MIWAHWPATFSAKRLLSRHGYQVAFQVHLEGYLEGFDRGQTPESWLSRQAIRPFFTRGDQAFSSEVIWIPTSGALSLARLSGAPLLSLFCYRDQGNIHLVVEPPLPVPERREHEREALRQYAARLESYVRRYPGQYHGWHLLGRRRV